MVLVKFIHGDMLHLSNLEQATSISVCKRAKGFTLSAFFKGDDIEHVLFTGEQGECEYWLNEIWEAWGSPDRMLVDIT